MILPDVNLLVYTVDETSSFHQAANTWLDDVLSSANPVGLCYPSMLGFVRLVTNRHEELADHVPDRHGGDTDCRSELQGLHQEAAMSGTGGILMKNPAHPGEFVKSEIIEALDLTVTEEARSLE